jgi:hypothetical protein
MSYRIPTSQPLPVRHPVRITGDALSVGDVTLTFQRTLRIPDDGRSYPLPPGLGTLSHPHACDDYKRPRARRRGAKSSGVFIPMYQREAMWISFQAALAPRAVKMAAGRSTRSP